MPTLLAYFRPHKQLGKQKIKPKYLGPGPPYCLQYATYSCVSLFPAVGVSGGTFKSQTIPLSPTVLWFGTTWWPIYDSHLNIHKRFRLLACWDLQTPPPATVSAFSARPKGTDPVGDHRGLSNPLCTFPPPYPITAHLVPVSSIQVLPKRCNHPQRLATVTITKKRTVGEN